MITAIIECERCGKRIEKKYPWIRDFNSDDFRNFYGQGGFSDDFLNMDVCLDCKDKMEDFTFRE